ncbi:MAG: c-type cytochrome biogenesis protein CcsB [Candidatus Abyssobacteria bacterium SURF_17]|uniref:C-type cytochrome biogenesis protein CcsB n=1 Tax=Candidatus Abyssobacteria bacterium SURF_17 TaxID=2093361 RepID=A0A419F1H5_9BACT|nr:MAG: c-type cytochrome biogenesis protein CcsB [Candidatus Abyssubacteria bacterium SURF_17]
MNVEILQFVSFYAAVLCLWTSAVFGVGCLFSPSRFQARYANMAAGAGFALLTAFFLLRWQAVGFLPVTNMFESLSFFIWAVALVYLVVEHVAALPTLSSFLLPVIALFTLVAVVIVQGPGSVDPKLQSAWFYLHVIFAFIGYATFAVAFAAAVMYLLQRRQLKSKKSFDSVFHRLPSLEVLDRLNQQLINMGFPLFTVAIAVGIGWAHRSEILGPNWPNDPKVVFTGITWLLYAALFHIRLLSVARGKRVAHLTIIAFVFVVFTFLGTRYLASGPHEFLK